MTASGRRTGRARRTVAALLLRDLRVRSRDEAVEWAVRLGEVLGDAEIDVRPLTEPWDLGLGRRPEGDPTARYMAVLKADRRSEAPRPGAALRRVSPAARRHARWGRARDARGANSVLERTVRIGHAS
jgi:hypothetical protein